MVTGGVVVVLAVGVELLAPRLVASGAEDAVRTNTDGVVEVDASASGFPFVPTLAQEGEVAGLTVTFREVADLDLSAGTLALEAEGIRLERAAMLRGDVRILNIDQGTASFVLDAEELSTAGGVASDLGADVVGLVGGVLEVAGTPVADVPVGDGVLPCELELETADDREIRLSCTFTGVPETLRPPERG